MSTICKSLSDLGASQCGFPMKVGRRLILVPRFDNSGNVNKMTLADIKVLANWELKFDAEKSLDRFYPLPNMENVVDERGDTEFFEWDSGLKVRIRQGARTFTGSIPNESPALLGKLQDWEGQDFGVYIIDTDGNVIFNYLSDSTGEYAVPIRVDGNSFDVKYVKSTYTDPLHIMLQFDFATDVNDKDLYMIPMDDADFDPRTAQFYALWNVYAKAEAWTVGTSLVWTLTLDFGVPASGFATKAAAVPTDTWEIDPGGTGTFAAFTDGTVAETATGVYTFTAGTTDDLGAGTVIRLKKPRYSILESTPAA